MCGQYILASNLDDLQGRFNFKFGDSPYHPRYNIAPTQEVLAVTNECTRLRENMRWGLVPHWAKDPNIGYRMINAKSETLASKPSFRTAYRKRRCLILASGFFEWKIGIAATTIGLLTTAPNQRVLPRLNGQTGKASVIR